MSLRIRFLSCALLFCVACPADAQHSDVLVAGVEGRLTSGDADFDTAMWRLGARVYTEQFDSDYAITDPGWNTLGVGSPAMPAGAESLPANTALEWDFVPLKIDGQSAGLFYWDGTGEVEFGGLPGPGYALSLQSLEMGVSKFFHADSSDELVPGAVLDSTDGIGSMHRHRFFFLDDGDGDFDTNPADGVYLVSIRTRMEGLDRSRPSYFAFGSLGSSPEMIAQAERWIDTVADDLAPDFSADFDGDLGVDVDDLTSWVNGYGTAGSAAQQIAGDANYDDVVGGADFLMWQQQAGASISTFTGATSPLPPLRGLLQVPEPSGVAIFLSGCAVLANLRRL